MFKGKEMMMKKLKNLLMIMMAVTAVMAASVFTVKADETTDLSDMKVYAVDSTGAKTEVPMTFSSTTYSYDLTVKSNVVSIEITATPKTSTSKWVVEKEALNTKMDTGTNLTVVAVTSSTGAVQKYTLKTKKLTTAEEATYVAPENNNTTTTTKNQKEKTVKVGKRKMKITASFKKSDIPDGFKQATAKYKKKKYTCIKGERKDITAFYLHNKKTEGFYIYDKDQDKFYPMNNIKVKSRMYTIVEPKEADGIVAGYEKKKITIIDQKVSAWALDEEEGMYLVYAMNWNGDTNLYSYDDNEKCFQRYLTSSDANKQSEAAAKAYNNLQKEHNKLVDRYNVLVKILCGLGVIIIILIFVIINLAISKKEKKIKKNNKEAFEKTSDKDEKKKDKKSKKEKKAKYQEEDEDDIDSGVAIDDVNSEDATNDKKQEPEATEDEVEELSTEIDADIVNEIADEQIEEIKEESPVVDMDDKEETVKEEPKADEEAPKRRMFGRGKQNRIYGDVPTYGTENESEEGFYGGEVQEEDEVFIDIVDDKDKEKADNTEDAEDLKSTMKSLLPEDDEEEDDDDDFEFINLD